MGRRCTDIGPRYVLEFGRMTGTSPASGRSYDIDAARLRDDGDSPVDTELAGTAWTLDRWLWGRGELTELEVSGSPRLVQRLRALVTDATQ